MSRVNFVVMSKVNVLSSLVISEVQRHPLDYYKQGGLSLLDIVEEEVIQCWGSPAVRLNIFGAQGAALASMLNCPQEMEPMQVAFAKSLIPALTRLDW